MKLKILILLTLAMVSAWQATAQTNTQLYFLTSFSDTAQGGLFIFAGTCPTNMTSITGYQPVYHTGDLRDSSMIEVSNFFYVAFNDEGSNSCRVIRSADMLNWSDYATLFVPDTFLTFWSPKFLTDASGNIYLTAFVQQADDQNYYMGVGTMSSDLTMLNNFQVMDLSSNPASELTDPNSSEVYFHSGVYYLFTGDGNEYTATDILANDWNLLTCGLTFGAGKSIAQWNGLFYLSDTETGSHDWCISADLTNWTNVSITNALTPELGFIGREGCFFTLPAPASIPIAVAITALTITPDGGNVVLSWPNLGNFALLQSADLASLGWTTNTAPMTTINGTNYVTITPPAGRMFYRLGE